MNISENLNRIAQAKASIKNAIEQKGVEVPNNAKISSYSQYIKQISGNNDGEWSANVPVGMTQDWATIVYGDNPKAIQFGTFFDLNNFSQSCDTELDEIDLTLGYVPREKVLSMYIGQDCIDVPNNVLANPMFRKTSQFNNLQLVDFGSCYTIGNNVLSGSPDFNGEIKWSDSLMAIGDNFMSGSQAFSHAVTLPESLTSVGNGFFARCDEIPEMYIPEATDPPSDRNSLTTTSKNATTYRAGLRLTGPGAPRWVAALPNSDKVPYRNLINVEDGKVYHRVRIQFDNGQADKIYVVEDGDTVAMPTPDPVKWIGPHESAVVETKDYNPGPIRHLAQFEGYAVTTDVYSVVLEYENNENVPYTLSVKAGETLKEQFTPHRYGQRFVGWAAAEPAEITYWQIKLDPNNGKETKSYIIPDGEVFYEPRTPHKLGAKFLGWTVTTD